MRKTAISLYLLLLAVLLTSCSSEAPKYRIGVSQCSQDIWREKQNAELRMGAYLDGGVELSFAAAYDSDERQVQQIDSLLATGIDLLIVAPNQVQTISPAIDRAYDSGIPVIVFERKTNSKKYTAYMGADNYEMGRVMGDYIAGQMGGRGRVVEVMGLKGSSPAQERHRGFADALAQHPDIELVATLQGDWTEESGYEAMLKYDGVLTNIDYVFGQNDRMAMGARRAISSAASRLPRFCGIDGLPGEGGGIQLVRDSLLDATYIYPTHGDRLLDLAVSILKGQRYDGEVMLKSALVTRENASVLLMQTEETLRQTAYLDQLHHKADSYLNELASQRMLTLLVSIILSLVTFTAVFVVISMRRRHRLERQAFSMVTRPAAQQTHPQPLPVREGSNYSQGETNAEKHITPLPHREGQGGGSSPSIADVTPEEQAFIEAEVDADARFLERLRQLVQEQMGNSDFSVETLASQMGVSRVQLYRKVKTQTGRTPVDIIRLSRLNRSRVLLAKEGTTVSEVAYAVGFSSPSYFTKCFKEEFGMPPGEARSA